MAKKKLKRFAEMETFPNVFQPSYDDVLNKDYKLKGKWNELVFKNNKPIVLELGCGRGEYTVGMSKHYSDKNFIGIDIKGARIWRGAKTTQEENINNAAFLRTKIEHIDSFFAKDEVSEIWITFPDPQLRPKKRRKKRLTSSRFLNLYSGFLKKDGVIHLKTDNTVLFNYTEEVVAQNRLNLIYKTSDLYNSGIDDEILSIKTHYEQLFTEKGEVIKYIKFKLIDNYIAIEPEIEEEEE